MLSFTEVFQARSRRLGPVGFAGLQVIFVTLTGQGVSHLSSIGLSQSEIAIALLSGPVCGAVFQPCFGRWSDQVQTQWGRRKPFIVIGAAVLILSLITLAWVESIIGISICSTESSARQRLFLVIVTFLLAFTIWVAIQAVQVGLRALISDGCSQDEQARANAWAGRYGNFAAAAANLVAYMDFLPDAAGYSRTAFKDMTLLASLALTITIIISCVSVREKQPDHETSMSIGRRGVALRDIWRVFFRSPNQIRTVCLVQFFAWMGWFPFLYYTVTYVKMLCERPSPLVGALLMDKPDKAEIGSEGSPESTADDIETRRGLLALLIYTSVALVASIVLPYLVTTRRLFGMRRLWIVSQAVFGISMLGTFITTSALGTIALFGIAGFSWAVSGWIPYALLGAETPAYPPVHEYELVADSQGEEGKRCVGECDGADLSNDMGLVYGVHNLSICLPQVLVTLGMSFERLVFRQTDTNLAWIFRLAGVFSLVAMFIARGVQEPS